MNKLAELHKPVDAVDKTLQPTSNVFEAHEACCLSQAGSLFVVEGETPMAPDTSKHPVTLSDDEDIQPTPFKHAKTFPPPMEFHFNCDPETNLTPEMDAAETVSTAD